MARRGPAQAGLLVETAQPIRQNFTPIVGRPRDHEPPSPRPTPMTDSDDKPFRILSLAGGGYLGLYTACVLTELEERIGEPLGRRFDLIAGTSVGGILAIALAFETPMRTV